MLWLGLAILLSCILIGARVGGIGLGAVSGLGLLIFVFVLGMPSGSPPSTVLGMIIAVITALSVMQVAGGSTICCSSRRACCDGTPSASRCSRHSSPTR